MASPFSLPEDLVTAIAPAISALRKVLQRREADDVPHALKRVVQSSGRSLPPPLLRPLLAHVETDSALREEALELLGTEDGPAFDYLERSDGWWQRLAFAIVESTSQRSAGELAEARKEQEAHEGSLATAKERIAELRQTLDATRVELKAARATNAARIEELRSYDRRRIAELERDAASRSNEMAALLTDMDELRSRLDKLRERSSRSDAARLASGTQTVSGFGGDPASVARGLDLAFRSFRSRSTEGGAVIGGPAGAELDGSLETPTGLRSSDPAWFEWLPTIIVPVWLIVDGHNVVFSISEDRDQTAESMSRLEHTLRRLRFRAAAPLRITVVYDSSQTGERPAPQAVGGLDLRFAPQHSIADDEIVALVTAAEGSVVVVTSDRELQIRIADRAIVIDGKALAGFVGG